MLRSFLALMLLGLIATLPGRAADEPAKKPTNSVERSVDKAGKAMGKTADKAEKGVKKGVAATEKGINSVGQKTGDWLNRQADRVK